jgi:hypothetical protein
MLILALVSRAKELTEDHVKMKLSGENWENGDIISEKLLLINHEVLRVLKPP